MPTWISLGSLWKRAPKNLGDKTEIEIDRIRYPREVSQQCVLESAIRLFQTRVSTTEKVPSSNISHSSNHLLTIIPPAPRVSPLAALPALLVQLPYRAMSIQLRNMSADLLKIRQNLPRSQEPRQETLPSRNDHRQHNQVSFGFSEVQLDNVNTVTSYYASFYVNNLMTRIK
jgi:hypothetical protein